MSDENGGWAEYKRLIVAEIARHDKWLRSLEKRSGDHETAIAVLKAKAALWGAAAGLVVGGIVALAVKAVGG